MLADLALHHADSPWEHQVSYSQAIPFWMFEKPIPSASVVDKYHNDYTDPEYQN